MRRVYVTGKYKKDHKLAKKRGKDLRKLETITNLLAKDYPLPFHCHPHKLSGDYENKWECQIEPDWLLIYDFIKDGLVLMRLGTHSDLFE